MSGGRRLGRQARHLALATIAACALGRPPAVEAQAPTPAARPTVSAKPGTLVRWSAPGTKRCGMKGRSWAAIEESCYYPIDILQKPATLAVVRVGRSGPERARIEVLPFDYGSENVELPDIPQANPSPEDLKRNAREQALVAKVWRRREGPAQFTLPLSAPANPLPKPKTFGWNRSFNGKPAAQPHMGADYELAAGTPILAAADGKVVLAQDLFYPGNAVFLDHGDGLFTMYFHLSEIAVEAGKSVEKGQRVGLSGSTGRSSGPHLFFGIRWHGARIDPEFLLQDPGKIPGVGSGSP